MVKARRGIKMGRRRAVALATGLALTAMPGFMAADTANAAPAGPHLTVYRPSQPPPGTETLCSAVPASCAGGKVAAARTPSSELALAGDINRNVNATLRPLRDPDGVGRSWTPPAGGIGDCKHYAVIKKQMLVKAGVDPGRLMLAIVAAGGPQMHAVLVLRTNERDVVLDNLSDRILDWRESGYTFLKMQRAGDGRRWDLILEGPRAQRG